MIARLARYGLAMLAIVAAACSSAANEPAPHPTTAPHTTTTLTLMGQPCRDARGFVYRAERCP